MTEPEETHQESDQFSPSHTGLMGEKHHIDTPTPMPPQEEDPLPAPPLTEAAIQSDSEMEDPQELAASPEAVKQEGEGPAVGDEERGQRSSGEGKGANSVGTAESRQEVSPASPQVESDSISQEAQDFSSGEGEDGQDTKVKGEALGDQSEGDADFKTPSSPVEGGTTGDKTGGLTDSTSELPVNSGPGSSPELGLKSDTGTDEEAGLGEGGRERDVVDGGELGGEKIHNTAETIDGGLPGRGQSATVRPDEVETSREGSEGADSADIQVGSLPTEKQDEDNVDSTKKPKAPPPDTEGVASQEKEEDFKEEEEEDEQVLTFEEFKKKMREQEGLQGQQRPLEEPGPLSTGKKTTLTNYASFDCGAKVIETNPEAQVREHWEWYGDIHT